MNRNKAKSCSLAAACMLVALLAYGCDQSNQSANTRPEAAQALAQGAQPGEVASRPSGNVNDDRYEVRSAEGSVAVGQKQRVELAITPGDGLKINKEFPWKFEFSPPQGVELAQTKVAGAQIELAESKATIPVYLEASSAGEHTLEATGDFSVCNDTKCYVIRDQHVSFALQAASSEQPAGEPQEAQGAQQGKP